MSGPRRSRGLVRDPTLGVRHASRPLGTLGPRVRRGLRAAHDGGSAALILYTADRRTFAAWRVAASWRRHHPIPAPAVGASRPAAELSPPPAPKLDLEVVDAAFLQPAFGIDARGVMGVADDGIGGSAVGPDRRTDAPICMSNDYGSCRAGARNTSSLCHFTYISSGSPASSWGALTGAP